MPPRSIQKELDDLRKEIAGLKADYGRLKGRAAASGAEGMSRIGAIRDELTETITAIKDKIADGTGTAIDDLTEQLNELRDLANRYSAKTEEAVTAHPMATIAGALVLGYLVGRLKR